MAKQSNATAEWKNMTVDPTTHGTNRARATADRTTHDGKTKQTRPQRRPLKSQSRSKTVANRPRNRRSKHVQSPTLPPHARPQPQTQSKKRFCLQKPCLQTAGDQTRGQTKVAKQTKMPREMRIEPQNQIRSQKFMQKSGFCYRKRKKHRRSNLIHNRTPG